MLVTKNFIKTIIDMAEVYVDELELHDYYVELIGAMSDNDVCLSLEYVGLNATFDNALEASGRRVVGDHDDEPFNYYGC